jgi:hypothetical protein
VHSKIQQNAARFGKTELSTDARFSGVMNVLTVNLLCSTLVFSIGARLYLWPLLAVLATRSVLLPILLLHAFRHLGLMFLAPGAVYPGIPPEFAYPAAYGDLLAAVLALIAIPAVATNASSAKPLVWLFNLEGTVDLVLAIALAVQYGADRTMGPAYWIPALWVPALLVTHYVTFVVLTRPWRAPPSRTERRALEHQRLRCGVGRGDTPPA